MRRGGDVEEHHLIGALLVVAQGQFDRVAHIAQPAGFGDAEPDAAGDLAVMHVQARYDTFSDHRPMIEPLCRAGINIFRQLSSGLNAGLIEHRQQYRRREAETPLERVKSVLDPLTPSGHATSYDDEQDPGRQPEIGVTILRDFQPSV